MIHVSEKEYQGGVVARQRLEYMGDQEAIAGAVVRQNHAMSGLQTMVTPICLGYSRGL